MIVNQPFLLGLVHQVRNTFEQPRDFTYNQPKFVCNTPVLTPFALNVYDVYIVINRGVKLKEKIPTMDYRFYVSVIKSVPMAFCASQARYDF